MCNLIYYLLNIYDRKPASKHDSLEDDENDWGSSSFFDNTMREIVFMDYLLMQRRLIVEYNIAIHAFEDWFTPNVYIAYARDEISVLCIQQLMMDVNLALENIYPRDALFVEEYKAKQAF